MLLLHTVQSAAAFRALRETGTLLPDLLRVDPFYRDAYDWMYRQMAARLPPGTGHCGCGRGPPAPT